VGEHREFNFGAQVGHSKSQPIQRRSYLCKGGGQQNSTCSRLNVARLTVALLPVAVVNCRSG